MRTPAHERSARGMHEAGGVGGAGVRRVIGVRGALGLLTLLAGPVFAAAGVVSVPDPLPMPLPPLPSSSLPSLPSLPSPSSINSAGQPVLSRPLAHVARAAAGGRATRADRVAAGAPRPVVVGGQADHADRAA
ncbi:MAG: hypothetical protein ACRYGL_03350, partial [Janthinobacterium lividum]